MCMATYIPGGAEIPYKGLENGATTNDDGHGFAIAAESGLMIVRKGMDFYDILDQFATLRAMYPDSPALFHSRWATHGSKNPDNAHPFKVDDYSVLAHNGIMPEVFHPTKGDDRTDSAKFASILSHNISGMWSRRERRRIGRMIGSYNKLVILSVNPVFIKPRGFVVNADRGYWQEDGVWFSNSDYKDSWYGAYRHAMKTGNESFDEWWADYKAYNGTQDDMRSLAPSTPVQQCILCAGDVDKNGYCYECATCQDCMEIWQDCDCFLPQSARRETADDDSEDHTPLALEAARRQDTDDAGGWVLG